jgi:regulator of sigma D
MGVTNSLQQARRGGTMLTRIDKTRQLLAGKNESIDALLDARHELLVQFVGLLGNKNNRKKCLPSCTQVQDFCQHLVDYISAGHFEIYQRVISAIEKASGRQLSIVNRILPKIEATTEFALSFNDTYGDGLDEEKLLELDADLNLLGPMLEERFRLEDRLVKALQILDEIIAA